jgi:hypothetical protein
LFIATTKVGKVDLSNSFLEKWKVTVSDQMIARGLAGGQDSPSSSYACG